MLYQKKIFIDYKRQFLQKMSDNHLQVIDCVGSKTWFILYFSRKMYFCVLDSKQLGVYGRIRVYGCVYDRKPIYGSCSPSPYSLVYI